MQKRIKRIIWYQGMRSISDLPPLNKRGLLAFPTKYGWSLIGFWDGLRRRGSRECSFWHVLPVPSMACSMQYWKMGTWSRTRMQKEMQTQEASTHANKCTYTTTCRDRPRSTFFQKKEICCKGSRSYSCIPRFDHSPKRTSGLWGEGKGFFSGCTWKKFVRWCCFSVSTIGFITVLTLPTIW